VVEAPDTLKYAMDLQAGSWAWVRVDQHGVDVAITTYSPNGSKLNEFDSPNGAFGPEWVRLEASVQGQYRIEVQAIDEVMTWLAAHLPPSPPATTSAR